MPIDLALLHAQDRSIQVNVFASGQLVMETGSDFQQRGKAAFHSDRTRSGIGDLGQDFEQRTFSGTIAPDDTDDLALIGAEPKIAQSPDLLTAVAGRCKRLPRPRDDLLA